MRHAAPTRHVSDVDTCYSFYCPHHHEINCDLLLLPSVTPFITDTLVAIAIHVRIFFVMFNIVDFHKYGCPGEHIWFSKNWSSLELSLRHVLNDHRRGLPLTERQSEILQYITHRQINAKNEGQVTTGEILFTSLTFNYCLVKFEIVTSRNSAGYCMKLLYLIILECSVKMKEYCCYVPSWRKFLSLFAIICPCMIWFQAADTILGWLDHDWIIMYLKAMYNNTFHILVH